VREREGEEEGGGERASLSTSTRRLAAEHTKGKERRERESVCACVRMCVRVGAADDPVAELLNRAGPASVM
jgi:hypothetical protein